MGAGKNRGVLRSAVIHAALVVGALVIFGSASASAQCVGDCNGDNEVRVNELITAVNILLGNNPLSTCMVVDANGNGTVAVNELIQAVNNLLRGCNASPLPTATPPPMVTSAACTLADASTLQLSTTIFPILLEDVVGEIGIECLESAAGTSGLSGDLSCTCGVNSFEAVAISGIGDVCIEPFAGCERRAASCGGGTAVDINLTGDHNIGECTGKDDCASQCGTYCDGLGSGYIVQASTCEDFCIGGSNDGASCAFDVDCPGGACGGPDGGVSGPICECVCAQPGAGDPAGAGAFSCSIGLSLTVELDGDLICGNIPPAITLDPVCGELTSGTSIGELRHAADSDFTIGPTTLNGSPMNCFDLASGSVSGMNLVGHLNFFGSAVGDLLVDNNFVCE